MSEMATFLPISSPFVRFAGRFVDPAFGVAAGYNFFLFQASLCKLIENKREKREENENENEKERKKRQFYRASNIEKEKSADKRANIKCLLKLPCVIW